MKRLTLGHVFYLSLLGLVVLLGALLALVFQGSERSIVVSSERLRAAYADRIGERVLQDLGRVEKSLLDLERQIRAGACRLDDPLSLEAAFFAEVINNPELSEVTLTYAPGQGHDADGRLRLGPGPRFQLSVFRETPAAQSPILTRTIVVTGGRAVVAQHRREATDALADSRPVPAPAAAEDPTLDNTFVVPSSKDFYGRSVWTDLSWAEADKARPEEARRVVLSVMKAALDRDSGFAGVLRVASRAEQVDHLTALKLEEGGSDPHVKFIADGEGRLVTRLRPGDRLADPGNDSLRVVPHNLPAEIAEALRIVKTKELSAEQPKASFGFASGGRRFLVSLRALTDASGQLPTGGLDDWRIGIVVPEDHYLGGLRSMRNRVMGGAALIVGLLLGGGLLTLGSVRQGLLRIVDETRRLRGFDFSPQVPRSPFADVREAMDGLELAKTAMRAMGKYVPLDLVRELYATNKEPTLGGHLAEVTMLFTDVQGFTTLAEGLSPDILARALGHYFTAMTQAVHATGGTVDKYIGDAVMALWNAPRALPDHAQRACRTALLCVDATRELYASEEWRGLPPLVTRFGLHRASVMVGHFGAPDRMSYTVLGDGVNLAARLEGLNKQYGTEILVSQAVAEVVCEAFAFRRIDRVAVKGKAQGVLVLELLGVSREVRGERLRSARAYEAALDLYFARDFLGALDRLEALRDDPPARVLAARCQRLLAEPPPPDWDGVYVAMEK